MQLKPSSHQWDTKLSTSPKMMKHSKKKNTFAPIFWSTDIELGRKKMIYSYPQLPLEDCRAVHLFPDYKDYIYEDVPNLPINKNTILLVKTVGKKNYLFLYLFKYSSYWVLIEILVKTISNRILSSELLILWS